MKQFGGQVLFLDRSDINTDEIIPAKYLTEISKQALKPYLLEDLKLDGFDPKADVPGKKVIITRENFGCGSSREHAPVVLKVKGIKCIVADSFARIFYRNAINIGLPVLEIGKDVEKIEAGDTIDVDMAKGEITIVNKNIVIKTKPLPEFIQKIADCGGLINYVKGENK